MRRLLLFFCFMAAAAALPVARALDIQLASGDWQPINLHVEFFLDEDKTLPGQTVSDIIARDLKSSGYFRVQKEAVNFYNALTPARGEEVRAAGGEYLLSGAVVRNADGSYTLQFLLYDALTEDIVGRYSIAFTADAKRLAAHKVSNWVYENVTGEAGIFHTKIAYVLRKKDGRYDLKIADYDGYNRLVVLSSEEHIISPAWSSDGNKLLYVSFERNKPNIYLQSLLDGSRRIIANFQGSNSAPTMAPDNRTIAAALTKHGGEQQIYLLTEDSAAERLRVSDGINTEPVFSADGRYLAYVSDESGQPQIYEYDREQRQNRRLTFDSRYNVSPDYSSKGKLLTYIRRGGGGGNNVVLMDIRSGQTTPLTETENIRLADSPSFSPNDSAIGFVDESRKKYFATVSINGKVTVFWDTPEEGEVIDPSWSPITAAWF